jgi:hypothetical protein
MKKIVDFKMDFRPAVKTDDENIDLPDSICCKEHKKRVFHQIDDDAELEKLLDWQLEPGLSYHILSNGNISSLSYLKFILRQQSLHYCLLSTWFMSMEAVELIHSWIRLDYIELMDFYVGETIKKWRDGVYERLLDICPYDSRVVMLQNHSKIIVGFGEKFNFVVEGSANTNENPRIENTVITLDSQLAYEYKNFFDKLPNSNPKFEKWRPCPL